MIDFFGMFKWPRAQWVGFANNHSIHHRGQLAAYLRAMGSKVPNIDGPSADAEPAKTAYSYLIPTTIESGPTSASTRVAENPASFIQPVQSAPV